MSVLRDETGNRYGNLRVVARAVSPEYTRSAHWLCQCMCGGWSVANGQSLRDGRTKSCGCGSGNYGSEDSLDLRRWLVAAVYLGPCTDCGESLHPCQMDLDHLYDKEFVVSDAWARGRSTPDITIEIAKCELVCSNCHRLRTHLRKVA